MNKKLIIFTSLIFLLGFVFYVGAFNEPTSNPPSDNEPTPINVSDVDQTKKGGFITESYLQVSPADAPSTGEEGMIYYDNTDSVFKCFQGSDWLSCIGGYFSAVYDSALKLVGIELNTNSEGEKLRITNVGLPIDADDVATKQYVNAQAGGGSVGGDPASGVVNLWHVEWQPLGEHIWKAGESDLFFMPLPKQNIDLVMCVESDTGSIGMPSCNVVISRVEGDHMDGLYRTGKGYFPGMPVIPSGEDIGICAKTRNEYLVGSLYAYVEGARMRIENVDPSRPASIAKCPSFGEANKVDIAVVAGQLEITRGIAKTQDLAISVWFR